MPRIENWNLISLNQDGHYQITGQTYDDSRTHDGDSIRTSTLKSIDFVKGEAQTLNTHYTLGNHANGSTMLGKDSTQIDHRPEPSCEPSGAY